MGSWAPSGTLVTLPRLVAPPYMACSRQVRGSTPGTDGSTPTEVLRLSVSELDSGGVLACTDCSSRMWCHVRSTGEGLALVGWFIHVRVSHAPS